MESGTEEDDVEALARVIISFLTWEAEMGFSKTTETVALQEQLVLDLIASTDIVRLRQHQAT